MRRIIAISLLLLCFLVVVSAVSQCKNHYREQGKQELTKALDKDRINILEQSAAITSEAMTQRDTKYTKIYEAGKEAAAALAGAVPYEEGDNEVDTDGVIPLAWSDALIMQYHRICGGSASCSAAGTNLQPKTAPKPAR